MNTQDLKIFEAVAAHSSFTKAAEATFTVQSNVTARVRSLEEEFGSPLFERNTRKVSLTPAGEILMHYSRQISHLINEAKKEIKSADGLIGSLKIGCIETTMALKVPGILNQFGEIYPQIELEFKSAMRGDLINDVLNYKLDAAFIPAPLNVPGLKYEVVAEERLVILAPGATSSVWALLEQKEMIKIIVFDQGCVFRARLEAWLSANGIVQYKAIVVNSLEGIINFVEAGLGISVLPLEIITTYYSGRNIKTLTMNKSLSSMSTILISRNNVPPSKALEEFINLFKTQTLFP